MCDPRKQKRLLGYIPFSGRFFQEKESLEYKGSFARTFCHFEQGPCFPSIQAIKNYRTLLLDIGMDPKTIIQTYKNKQQQTVLLEYIQRG